MRKVASLVVMISLGLGVSVVMTGCGSDNKTKLEAGLTDLYNTVGEAKKTGKSQELARCLADKINGKISDKTFKLLSEGKDLRNTKDKDYNLVATASQDCMKKILKLK